MLKVSEPSARPMVKVKKNVKVKCKFVIKKTAKCGLYIMNLVFPVYPKNVKMRIVFLFKNHHSNVNI